MKKGFLAKIGQYADRIETAVASIAFAFMCLFVLVTIVFRYVLRQPISWTEEASRYLMITGIFVAMPVAVRSHVHLGVDLFINLLPKGGKRFAEFFSDAITLLAYFAIDYACYLFVIKALAGSQTSPAMHIPMVIMYIIIMVGFVLATVAQLANMVEEYVHHTTETEEAEK